MSSTREQIRARLTPEQRVLENWVYEATRVPAIAVLILGTVVRIEAEHPEKTFWQALSQARQEIKIICIQEQGPVC